MIHGRFKGAKSWQEHFSCSESRMHGSEVTVESHPNMSDTPLRACVDEGHGCGKETIVAEMLAFLSVKNEMKHVRKIWKSSCGALENFENARRTEIDEHTETRITPNLGWNGTRQLTPSPCWRNTQCHFLSRGS